MPPYFIPLIAFAVWALALLSYLPLLKLGLPLADQLVAPQFLVSGLLLVVVWALSGPITASVLSALSILFILYLALAFKQPSFMIQALFHVALFIGAVSTLHEIQRKNNRKDIVREKLVEDLTLVRQEQQKKDELKYALEQKIRRYLGLQKFSEDLKNIQDLGHAAQRIVQEAHTALAKAEECALYLVNEAKQELSLAAGWRRDGASVRLKLGSTFDQWVMKRSQTLMIQDSRNDFRFSTESGADFGALRSTCVTPLVTENRVLGVLRVSAAEPGVFNADDLRFLNIISNLSAVVLRNMQLYEKMQELALKDSLTGLYLNRYFQERLGEEIARSHYANTPFSLVMLDIDHFKRYNDEYGHAAGDLVLKHIASAVSGCVGEGDLAARYGGEEFALILPNRSKQEAVDLAETLRARIEKNKFTLRRVENQVTASLGVAGYPEDGQTKEDLVRHADKNLYEAKNSGRNRVCGSF